MAHECDIAVLGATLAGLAAAYSLASRAAGWLVDAPAQASESTLTDWVPR